MQIYPEIKVYQGGHKLEVESHCNGGFLCAFMCKYGHFKNLLERIQGKR